MSDESPKVTGGAVASTLAFPVITGAGEVISVAKRNGGLSASKVGQELEMFKKMNEGLKTAEKDVFSRGLVLADNYETYKSAAKASKKLSKYVVETAEGTTVKIPLKERALNVLRRLRGKEEVTEDIIQSRQVQAAEKLEDITKGISNAQNVTEKLAQQKAQDAVEAAQKALSEATTDEAKQAAQKALDSATKNAAKTAANAAKAASQSTLSKVGTLFKQEAKNPLVLFFTAIQAIPEITNNVIPAFKEKGFKAGMKQAGISLLKVGSNFLSMTLGTVAGKVAGAAIGTVICPGAGSAVGSKVGSILGTTLANLIGNKVVQKISDKAAKEEQEEAIAQAQAQTRAHGQTFDMAM